MMGCAAAVVAVAAAVAAAAVVAVAAVVVAAAFGPHSYLEFELGSSMSPLVVLWYHPF